MNYIVEFYNKRVYNSSPIINYNFSRYYSINKIFIEGRTNGPLSESDIASYIAQVNLVEPSDIVIISCVNVEGDRID